MKEIVVVCEGRTEVAFVAEVLGPSLWPQEVFLHPRLISTSASGKGGALTGPRVIHHLRNLLRERWAIPVTTFFDLYGLPPDFPGVRQAEGTADPLQRAAAVEAALHAAAVKAAGRGERRFHPHIQPYEFEGLLFSDPTRFGEVRKEWADAEELWEARRGASSPEHINDGAGTHPSARLGALKPRFHKSAHGVEVASRIGIERIRAECRHFDGWVSRLEQLSAGLEG